MDFSTSTQIESSNTSPDEIMKAVSAEMSKKSPTSTTQPNLDSTSIQDLQSIPKKAKRPVNGFMAFRSRYFKIFPTKTQKEASSLLTMLWAKDPWKHRWALIAKVYSFARDELNSPKFTLAGFLETACPLMELPTLDRYLVTLGWSMYQDKNGQITGEQVRDRVIEGLNQQTSLDYVPPSTELELLTSCVAHGFALGEGPRLITKMGCKDNILMAVDPEGILRPDSATRKTLEKKLYIYDSLRKDPSSVAANILGVNSSNVFAEFVTVEDFLTQHIDMNEFHMHIITNPETSPVDHSYYMNGIVDRSLTHRPWYHLSLSMPEDAVFDISATDQISEYHNPLSGRLDDPNFLNAIVNRSINRESQYENDGISSLETEGNINGMF